ncbi:MAG: hypothetical protein ABI867_02110 [Kofleriaceae bacterium]
MSVIVSLVRGSSSVRDRLPVRRHVGGIDPRLVRPQKRLPARDELVDGDAGVEAAVAPNIAAANPYSNGVVQSLLGVREPPPASGFGRHTVSPREAC